MTRRAEHVWLLLWALTFAGAWLAETGRRGDWLTAAVAVLIVVKGRLVVDHYMELRSASRVLRRIVLAFVLAVPTLMLVFDRFGGAIARATALR